MRRIYRFLVAYSAEKSKIEDLIWIPKRCEDDMRHADEVYADLESNFPPTCFFIGRAFGGSYFILSRSTSSKYIREQEILDHRFASTFMTVLHKYLDNHNLWWLMEY